MRRLSFGLGLLVVFLLVAGAPALLAQSSPRSGGASKSVSVAPTSPVNLNTATEAQLEALPGVGASTARRIIEYRQKNGAFKKIEELMNVKGIGEKSFLKLKPLITVTPDKADRGGDD
jgi:competence protein ComEA